MLWLVRLLAAAVAGVGAWCSAGTLAVAPSGGRLGVLPSPVWLSVGIAACVALLTLLRSRRQSTVPLFAAVVFILPWLPGDTFTPALIFTGPLVGLWWTLIVLGCIAAGSWRLPASCCGLLRAPTRAPWLAGAIVALIAGGAAWHYQALLPGGDEPHYLVMTQSLLYDGDLQIENNHRDGHYVSYFGGELKPDFLRRGANRQIYSIHAPGLSALIAPAFALAGYPGVVVFLVLWSALGAALMWHLAYLLTNDATAAWVGWAAVTTSITFMAHAFMIFPDGPSSVCALVGIWALLCVGRRCTPRAFMLMSLVVSLLPWLHTRNAPMALVLGVSVAALLLRARRIRPAMAWLSPLAISAIAWLAFFRVIYGVWDPRAPYGTDPGSRLANIAPGLLGLLFDQQFGQLAYAPALSAGFVGLALMMVARPKRLTSTSPSPRMIVVTIALTTIPYAMMAASYTMWWGGASAPARFLAPTVMLFGLPAAWLWANGRHATRSVLLALIGVSGVVLAALLTVYGGALTFNDRDGFALLADWASPVADLAQALPAFHRDPRHVFVARASTWLVVPLLCWVVARVWPRHRSRGALALSLLLVGSAASMGAASWSWSLTDGTGRRPDVSQARLLTDVAIADASAIALAYRTAPRPDGLGRLERALVKRIPRQDMPGRLVLGNTARRPPRNAACAVGPLPAGRYRVSVDASADTRGQLGLTVGRDGAILDEFAWDADPQGARVERTLSLALPVRLMALSGDATTVQATRQCRVLPLEVRAGTGPDPHTEVQRVASSGDYLLYLLSESQYAERHGLWIRPGATAPMLVAPRDGVPPSSLAVVLQNGPIQNTVTLTAGTAQTLTLQPDERRIISIHPTWTRGAMPLSVRAEEGFRPFAIDPASNDRRLLGVWFELQ